jgi:Domain of unknown function (DUF4376)
MTNQSIYSEYCIDTGKFTGRTLTCTPEHIDINRQIGCEFLLGEYDSKTQGVVKGKLWKVPLDQQTSWSTMDAFTGKQPELVDLKNLRDLKWQEIKLARARVESAGFEYAGKHYQSDTAVSQSRIMQAASIALTNPAWVFDWVASDNTISTLTSAQMLGLNLALNQHIAACFSIAQVLREHIYTANREQLAVIKWPKE